MLVKILKGAFMKLAKLICLLTFIIIAGCGSNQPTAGNIDPSLAKIGDPFKPDLWPEGCPNPLQPDQDPAVQLSCAIQYLVKLPDGTPFTNPSMSWTNPDIFTDPDTPNGVLFRPGPGGNGSTNCDSPSVTMSSSGGDRGVFANCSGSVSLTIGLGGGNPGLRATVSNGSGSVTANIGGSGTTSSGNYGSSSGGFATSGMRDYCALYPYSSICW
jgi:hypothetical protein